jgi:hypothetical protein
MYTSFKSIMKSLRLPVTTRLQKKHDINLVLSTLRHFGILIPGVIGAHHIMDGYREMVLALMRRVISHCCMTRLLQENMVEQEILSKWRTMSFQHLRFVFLSIDFLNLLNESF